MISLPLNLDSSKSIVLNGDISISHELGISRMDTATTLSELQEIYKKQYRNFHEIGQTSAKERIAKLKRLRKAITTRRKELQDAMWKDFKKPAAEVDLSEIYTVTSDIDFAVKHLRSWMRPKPVRTPITMLGASSKVVYEPKGMALIIAPWNYPVLLVFAPLVSAIAAGNTVMVKPSEFTTATLAVIRQIIEEVFDQKEVAVVEGGIAVSQALLELKFNHIFFTGSPTVGKIVMEAAAKHLTSVTLELGGKSPVIIDETANINATVARIVWAKFINAGQTCLAPDYVLVHKDKKGAFLAALVKQLKKSYGEDASDSADYAAIVNEKHYQRLKGHLESSLDKGSKLVHGGVCKTSEKYIAPTVLEDVALDSALMQEEIFGPILPVFSYTNRNEVTDLINSKEKPLALYIYSKNKKNIEFFMANTSAGGSCINISAIHIGNPHLPFGGVNNSGIGKSNGHFGFLEFSNQRGVMRQYTPSIIQLLLPPYTHLKRRLLDFTLRWL